MKGGFPPHYQTLEVTPQASVQEIRAAYRRLAKRFHPDANRGDPQAEERFKGIGEAYRVLADPATRRLYDGAHAVKSSAAGSRQRQRPAGQGAAGRNIKIKVYLTLEEALKGGHKSIRYPRDIECLTCSGSGHSRQSKRECDACGGKGVVRVNHSVKVNFSPGVRPDETITIPGAGHHESLEVTAGDLLVIIGCKKHPYFEIKGADLHYNCLITLDQIIEGGRVRVPTAGGTTWVEVPPRFPDGGTVRLQGKGLPERDWKNAGDIVVTVRHCLPRKLSTRERAKLHELLKLPGFSPHHDEKGLVPRED